VIIQANRAKEKGKIIRKRSALGASTAS